MGRWILRPNAANQSSVAYNAGQCSKKQHGASILGKEASVACYADQCSKNSVMRENSWKRNKERKVCTAHAGCGPAPAKLQKMQACAEPFVQL